MKAASLSILLIMISLLSTGQDTVLLKTFSIRDAHIQEMQDVNRQVFDSLTMERVRPLPLSEALATYSPVFIKSYGQGAMASSSFRGAGASHTQVLWNGININSPTLGQMDFSLIPVSMIDRLTILSSGNSVYSSSGGLGGAILLDNKPRWDDSLSFSLNQKFSSLKLTQTSVENNLIVGKLIINSKIFHLSSDNEYSFKNNTSGPPPYSRETQTNAAYTQTGIMEDIYLKINNNNTLSLKFWAQQNFREIPKPLTVKQRPDTEEQDNDFVRTLFSWERQNGNEKWLFRSGWFLCYYDYRNPVSSLQLHNRSRLWTNQLAYKLYPAKSFNLEIGLNSDLHKVESSNYNKDFTRHHYSIYSRLLYNPWKKLSTLLTLRGEMIDRRSLKMLPSLTAKYRIINNKLILTANIARNLHYPTMNDLYWYPGGNPDLKEEEGYNYEAGLEYNCSNKQGNFSWKASANYFYSDIRNLILWQPDSIASYWTPSNLKDALSRGIESKLQFTRKWQKNYLSIRLQYHFTQAENQTALVKGDASVSKQLIYVPKHAATAVAYIKIHSWYAAWNYSYTGRRYTAADNSRYMPPFMLHDAEVGKSWELNNFSLSAAFHIENLLNTDYQSVAWYPMPGRIYNLKISLKWKKY